MNLDEFIEVQTVEIKSHAKVVSKYKVVFDLNHTFSIFRIVLFE